MTNLISLSLLIFCLFSCGGSQELDVYDDLGSKVHEHFKSHAEEDSIQVNTLSVSAAEGSFRRLKIFWEIEERNNENFILEYNEMLLRTLDPDIINQFDSVILEIQIPKTAFGLKRYRATSQEVANLRNEYSAVDSAYIPILKYIMRTNSSDVVLQWDEIMSVGKHLDTLVNASWKQYDKFLDYLQYDFLVKQIDISAEHEKIEAFKSYFGTSTFFNSTSKPLNLANFILAQVKASPITFTLADTLQYGFRPVWLNQ